jgi:hypothetical protein
MKRATVRILVVMALVLAGILLDPAPSRAVGYAYPRTDGTFVVWKNQPFTALTVLDLRDGRRFEVPLDYHWVEFFDIDHGLVVWSQYDPSFARRDIWAHNLNTGEQFIVRGTAEDETLPAIHGSQLVYMSWDDTSWKLKRYDLSAPKEPDVLADLGPGVEPDFPYLDGDYVVWRDWLGVRRSLHPAYRRSSDW